LLKNLKGKDEFNDDIVYEYTGTLRDALLESLKKHFGELIKDDLFTISKLPDQNFGLCYQEIKDQRLARLKLIALIKIEEAKQGVTSTNEGKEHVKEISRINSDFKVKKKCNFVQFQPVKPVNKEIIEDLVDNFINTVTSGEFKQCALLFWKAH
jgi:hypothetical protein